MFTRLVCGIFLATLALTPAALAHDPAKSKVTVVFDHALPKGCHGDSFCEMECAASSPSMLSHWSSELKVYVFLYYANR